MKQVLICHNMRVFYWEKDSISQREICDIDDINNVVCLDNFGSGYALNVLSGDAGWLDVASLKFRRAIPACAMSLHTVANDKIALSCNGKFLRANHLGSIDCVVENPSLWEYFKLLTIEEFSALLKISRNQWIINNEEKPSQICFQKSNFEKIFFGEYELDFNSFIYNAIKYSSGHNFLFFRDWQPVPAVLLNPVIVLVVFGNGKVVDQYKKCIYSISEISNYSGKIIILSNLGEDYLVQMAPKKIQSSIDVVEMTGLDTLDFVGARLSIFNTNILDDYQPIIYSDVDIVFDKEIEPFLVKGAQYGKCSAQIEEFHYIGSSDHTGAQLVKQDFFDCENLKGFNGGLLLIPNMSEHGLILKAAYNCITRYITEHGRNSIAFYDQSVLNYVLYKLNDFDGRLVSEHTQIGGDEHPVRSLPLDPSNPRGFVHFWNSAQRVEAMESYMTAVTKEASK